MAEKRKRADTAEGVPPPDGRELKDGGFQKVGVTSSMASEDLRYQELYSKPPDFQQLALVDPDFAPFIKGRRDLDFNDPASVMQLTKTLLQQDFGLKIELPKDRLCPPVANRHNYILWLKKLLDTSSYEPPGRKAVGLDIGTGASCIYPLLGCTQRPWSFIATDIDQTSLDHARKNAHLNDLDKRVQVVHRTPDQSLIPLDDLGMQSIDFCMTNPPFYESEEAMLQSAREKSRPPSTACTGVKTEMVTEGGEVGFVHRILTESLVLCDRVQWYTAMFGFLSSVTSLLEKLKDHDISNFAVTVFVQGNKTRRWAVAWSFGSMRPSQDVARGTSAVPNKSLMPVPTEVEVVRLALPENKIGVFCSDLQEVVGALELVSWEWDQERTEGIGRAVANVWNRAWRRRKKRERCGEDAEKDMASGTTAPEVKFGFKVWARVGRDEEVAVGCRWVEGHDASIFESFHGGFLLAAIRDLCKKHDATIK